MNAYKVLQYGSWKELKSDITYDICKGSSFPQNRYIFRGQRDDMWKLKTTFDRMYGNKTFEERKKIENFLLEQFTELCVVWDGKEKFREYDKIQMMSIGQHYGLPTRLLDWTYSLYIAAFFAFCSACEDSSNIAIWIIDKEHEIWKGDYGVTVHTRHMEENERQKYQCGLFTLNASPEETLDDYVKECGKRHNIEGALYKVMVPTGERVIVLRDLDMMGINCFNMYRGLEGCAKSAVLKEVLRQ